MKKAILLSLVLILLIFTGCEEESTTVYVEPEQTAQQQTTEQQTQTQTETQQQTQTEDYGSVDIDLGDYPSPFFKGDKLNAYIIVGAKATSLEVVAATELLAGVDFTGRLGDYYPDALDTDMSSIKNKNAILIGNPCNNKFIKELMPYSSDCLEDYGSGEAIIKLFKTGSDSYALVVGGHSGADTRRAAQYLGAYESKSMSGTEIKV